MDASVAAIQADIVAHGPAQASMYLVAEFEVYTSGVFTTRSQEYIGAHAVKLVGWGVDGGVDYCPSSQLERAVLCRTFYPALSLRVLPCSHQGPFRTRGTQSGERRATFASSEASIAPDCDSNLGPKLPEHRRHTAGGAHRPRDRLF